MKRVLVLAYHFPPVGGAGVQRVLKFARYLPDNGFKPIVVTGPIGAADRWTPHDETLHRELPGEVEILRVPPPEPGPPEGWRGVAERWLRRERWTKWWIDGAYAVAREVHDVDVILCSMSPFQSATAATRVSEALAVPWVADLRDPWALDEMMVYNSRVHRALELRLMRRRLGTASAVVMNTRTAADALRQQFPEMRRSAVAVIPNGFDKEDFESTTRNRSDGAFRIVHAGYLHTDVGLETKSLARRLLGGSTPGVNILSRSHVYLLRAVDRLSKEHPELGRRIEVHLAGVLSDDDRKEIGSHPSVRVRGYLPHTEVVDLLHSADLLFLPMHDLPQGRRATIVPGKTYEYLASGRPILAAVPDGDARDLLSEAGDAWLCRPTDVDAMAQAILGVADRGSWTSSRDPSVVRRFERRELTRQLAEVLDGVVTGRTTSEARTSALVA